jgi:hypothetical protein
MAAVTSRVSGLVVCVAVACVPTDNKQSKQQESAPVAEPRITAPPIQGLRPVPRPITPIQAAASALAAADAARSSGDAAPAPSAKLLESSDPLLRKPFTDAFDRHELGPDWRATSPNWQIRGGQLCGSGAHNHPVWLARRLPTNARIEFEAKTASTDGDIKAELWGDGRSAATGASYTNASSYLTIFGGWKNQFHVLARIDEHAPGRPEIKINAESSDLRARPVRANQAYQFKVERSDGKTLRWSVDDIEMLSFSDPNPLKGRGHDHFGFNDWEVTLCFDNLKITPLEGE